MALTGFGTIPGGAAGTELAVVTRRAIMPACVVQFGKDTPSLSAMLAAAEPVTGGVSPITIPVQGNSMVSGGYVDYTGNFGAPSVITGLNQAQYNLCAVVIGIPYYMFEGFVQNGADIVPLAWARMNDAGNFIANLQATKLWAAQSANSNLEPFSLHDVISITDPTQGALGNLAVATETYWKSNVATMTSISGTTAINASNALAALQYAQNRSGGEAPSCALVSPGMWAALAASVVANERYIVDREGTYADAGEGATIGFPAINIGGIPWYADPYETVNTEIMFPNWNYLSQKIHAEAAYAVAGPESLLPQFSLGYVMALFCLHAVVCSKRAAQSQVTTVTGAFTGV